MQRFPLSRLDIVAVALLLTARELGDRLRLERLVRRPAFRRVRVQHAEDELLAPQIAEFAELGCPLEIGQGPLLVDF